MKTIFISDVHMGINIRENWYQPSAHEKYLKSILKDIINNAEDVQDVIMLGDWFDTWVYPCRPKTQNSPEMPNITISKIIDAHPNMFNRQKNNDGDFITCMDSIKGNLYFVNGNHDMGINCAELNNCLKDRCITGKKVECFDSNHKKNLICVLNDIYAEHGHCYSVMNRPDRNGNEFPLGYFITRICSLHCKRELDKSGCSNASQLPHSGNPDKEEILKKLISDIKNSSPHLAYDILNAFTETIGYKPEDIIFDMPDGSSIDGYQVSTMYPNDDLFKTEKDLEDFYEVDCNNNLDNEGRRLCNSGHKIVIFGHTHKEELKSYGSNYYANSGYLCPPNPSKSKISHVYVEHNYPNLMNP